MAVDKDNLTYVLGAPGTGWRELDIKELIIQQNPTDTPFFELTGTSKAFSTRHEWQNRALAARQLNAKLEGATFAFNDVSGPYRSKNTCQILEQGVEVSATSLAERHYGAKDLMKDQINLRATEHRNDIEFNLIRGTESTGNTDGARVMAGLLAVITTNATSLAGVTLTETIFIEHLLQKPWLKGAPVNTVLTAPRFQSYINKFDSMGATRYLEVATREVINNVLVYQSSFGTVQVHMSKDLSNGASNGEIVSFDKMLLNKAYLRTTVLKTVPSDSDGERMAMLTELTLEHLNEFGSAKITNAS